MVFIPIDLPFKRDIYSNSKIINYSIVNSHAIIYSLSLLSLLATQLSTLTADVGFRKTQPNLHLLG